MKVTFGRKKSKLWHQIWKRDKETLADPILQLGNFVMLNLLMLNQPFFDLHSLLAEVALLFFFQEFWPCMRLGLGLRLGSGDQQIGSTSRDQQVACWSISYRVN
ncbi:hypothetical protein GBA52_007087 [Prunus armeniaca]|nr:hypothetical protein GBA52_007087 [Prunus armeniaca]